MISPAVLFAVVLLLLVVSYVVPLIVKAPMVYTTSLYDTKAVTKTATTAASILNTNNATAVHCTASATTRASAKCFVILSNIQSGNNIGDICRNALAFNVSEVIVIGKPNFRSTMRGADRGAKTRLAYVNFPSIVDVAHYLKHIHNATIYGIEITHASIPITAVDFPIDKSTAFIFGNEGGGLNDRQRSICDGFLYIPQYASGGMASINVACASAIVLSTFANKVKYPETARVGEKFV